MLSEVEIEELAEGVVKAVGLDPFDVVDSVRLARRIVGSIRTLDMAGPHGDAVLCRVHGQRRIYVRSKLPPKRFRWALLHECAEALLQDQGYRSPDVELVAERLAASLGVPLKAARSVCSAVGPKWGQLALNFGTSYTSAALRFSEATRRPLMLDAPTGLRKRGRPYPWPETDALQSWKPSPGVKKAVLRDAPARRVFMACDSASA